MKSAPSNLSSCKIAQKNNLIFLFFLAKILKRYCDIWNQLPQICWIARLHEKTKKPKYGIENDLFGFFWTQQLQICLVANFHEKEKNAKIWEQKCLIWCFWARILKNYCDILNEHIQIYLFPKFPEKIKMPKTGSKNALLFIFGLEF